VMHCRVQMLSYSLLAPEEKPAATVEQTVRAFTSIDGKIVEAQILDAVGANVTIRRIDGVEFTIPLPMLVKEDQVFIAEWRIKNGKNASSSKNTSGDGISADEVDWKALFGE